MMSSHNTTYLLPLGSPPVLSGAEIHDTSTIALSSSIPLIGSPPEATTLPDNTLDTIVESNKMDEVIMQEDIDDDDDDEDAGAAEQQKKHHAFLSLWREINRD